MLQIIISLIDYQFFLLLKHLLEKYSLITDFK